MRQHDNIATFVQSSGEITSFLERIKTTVWKPHSVAQNLENVTFCDEKVPRAKHIKVMPGPVEVAAGAKHSVVRTNQAKLYGFTKSPYCPPSRGTRPSSLFAPKPTLYEPRHALGETLHISILATHDAPV